MAHACLWFPHPPSPACVGTVSCREQGVCATLRAPGDAPRTMPTTANLDVEPVVGLGRVYHRQDGVARTVGDGEMIHSIHMLGASGAGTRTVGRALIQRLQCPHFDT